jgi:3-phenylpropionate/cinnamic acid dioxygenase small subunit
LAHGGAVHEPPVVRRRVGLNVTGGATRLGRRGEDAVTHWSAEMDANAVSRAMMAKPVTVETLVARAQIGDVVIRYATGIDTRDWDLYRSVFADEVDFDFSSFRGAPARMTADDWVKRVRRTQTGFDATTHYSSNHVIDLNGDAATCVSYMVAHHVLKSAPGGTSYMIGGHYINRLRQIGGAWKIEACTLKVAWQEGNFHIFALGEVRSDAILGQAK